MCKITLYLFMTVLALIGAANIDRDATILSFKNEYPDALGHYAWAFESSNGIHQQETGDGKGAKGGFEYVAPDGQKFLVTYLADENGFRPTGAHLPTPPPIPEEILRSLEYNAAHPEENGLKK